MISSQRANIHTPKKQFCSFKAINSEKVISLANFGEHKNNLIVQNYFCE